MIEYTMNQLRKKKNQDFFKKIRKLFRKSMKPYQTDELIALIFFRPLAFLLALAARAVRISPNVLSVIRGIIGITAGVLFIFATPESIFWGGIILLISTLFDLADGQLARLSGTSSKMGTIIDGIADGFTVGFVYFGTFCSLLINHNEPWFYWFILTALASLSFLIQLNSFGFLRHEYLFYVCNDNPEARVTLEDLKKEYKRKNKKGKFFTALAIIFNIAPIELVSALLLPKNYKGYHGWYKKDTTITAKKKEVFKKHYKKKNGLLLQWFGNLGMISNLLVFSITAFFNRLDIGIFVILIGCNMYFILLTIIQRLYFKRQCSRL